MRWAAMAMCLLLAGCGVFRNTTRDKRLEKVEARVRMDIGRVDTSKRLVLERWGIPHAVPGREIAFGGSVVNRRLDLANGLFGLSIELDSLGAALSGTLSLPPQTGQVFGERLTIEHGGVSEHDRSEAAFETVDKADYRSGTASWKGVWVWLGGIALVLVFLYLLIRYLMMR